MAVFRPSQPVYTPPVTTSLAWLIAFLKRSQYCNMNIIALHYLKKKVHFSATRKRHVLAFTSRNGTYGSQCVFTKSRHSFCQKNRETTLVLDQYHVKKLRTIFDPYTCLFSSRFSCYVSHQKR